MVHEVQEEGAARRDRHGMLEGFEKALEERLNMRTAEEDARREAEEARRQRRLAKQKKKEGDEPPVSPVAETPDEKAH